MEYFLAYFGHFVFRIFNLFKIHTTIVFFQSDSINSTYSKQVIGIEKSFHNTSFNYNPCEYHRKNLHYLSSQKYWKIRQVLVQGWRCSIWKLPLHFVANLPTIRDKFHGTPNQQYKYSHRLFYLSRSIVSLKNTFLKGLFDIVEIRVYWIRMKFLAVK